MRILILLTIISCTSQQTTTKTDQGAAQIESAASKTPQTKPQATTSRPATKPAEVSTPPVPKGTIGGAPILSNPVVIGGISREDVEQGIAKQQAAIDKCYQESHKTNAALAGKVLVQVVIAADGSVSETLTKATSLRHKPTEECINKSISKASFPKLLSGRYAMVQYPFAFGNEP